MLSAGQCIINLGDLDRLHTLGSRLGVVRYRQGRHEDRHITQCQLPQQLAVPARLAHTYPVLQQ